MWPNAETTQATGAGKGNRWHAVRRLIVSAGMVLVGCTAPVEELTITLVPPLRATVGHELTATLAVALPPGEQGTLPVQWSWRSLKDESLSTRLRRPSLTAYTLGRAVWRWTPIATDTGPQEIEVAAAMGTYGGFATLKFQVEAGGGGAVFREPVGEGTTLDLRTASCARIALVVESESSTQMALTLQGDAPDTARIEQSGDLAGTLVFCPSPEQVAADTIYPLLIQAADDVQVIQKAYVVVLRRAS